MNQGFTTFPSGAAHLPEYTIEQMDNMITALSDNGYLMNGYRITFAINAIYAGLCLLLSAVLLGELF